MSDDRATDEVIQNVYEVEFSRFEAVQDWKAAAK
jgi:hypothetical protein